MLEKSIDVSKQSKLTLESCKAKPSTVSINFNIPFSIEVSHVDDKEISLDKPKMDVYDTKNSQVTHRLENYFYSYSESSMSMELDFAPYAQLKDIQLVMDLKNQKDKNLFVCLKLINLAAKTPEKAKEEHRAERPDKKQKTILIILLSLIGLFTIIGIVICLKNSGDIKQPYGELGDEPVNQMHRSNNARNLERG